MAASAPELPPCPIAYAVESGGVPVFRPTTAQFADFHRFMADVQPIGALTGLIKVVPPSSFVPNASHYTNISSSFPVHSPIEQNIAGQTGIFQVLSVTQPTCTVSAFIDATIRAELARSRRELQWAADGEYERLEECYWKNIGFSTPVYGADSPGSLFDAEAPWNMARLHTLLDLVPADIGGVTAPMMYFGQWKASFAFHIEVPPPPLPLPSLSPFAHCSLTWGALCYAAGAQDVNLYSINYIHFGHPKQWYGIAPAQRGAFEQVIASYYPQLLACTQFLRHKDVLCKPSRLREKGIRVVQTIQREGEFMITFPCAYHQGFNLGFKCQSLPARRLARLSRAASPLISAPLCSVVQPGPASSASLAHILVGHHR